MRLSPGRIKSSHGPGISVWLQVAYPCASVLNCVRNQTKAKSLFVHCSFSTSFTFFFHHFPLALVGSRLVSACAVCLIGSIFRVRNALVEGFVSTSAETCLILACISCHWHFLIFSTFLGVLFGVPLDTSLVDTKATLTRIVVYYERISRTTNLVNRLILMCTQIFALHISIYIFV